MGSPEFRWEKVVAVASTRSEEELRDSEYWDNIGDKMAQGNDPKFGERCFIGRSMIWRRCPDPGCKDGTLQPEACRDVIPTPMFQRWGATLCDMALEGLKFYCPFNDCSTPLVDDHQDGNSVIRDVECPHCSRMFCAQCKVPWHDGVDCAEFQRLGKDERGREDLLLRKVVQESKCGHHFCYLYGSAMVKGNHRCSKCPVLLQGSKFIMSVLS
ncbi:uncharacterized protein LOC119346834, partial [Triticum dicoccoides]|uniref:uncharacterized protein LOC119346834 n=1 Tax=Triticum dicoccoides TaxID=85692 RepID=UPI00188F7456